MIEVVCGNVGKPSHRKFPSLLDARPRFPFRIPGMCVESLLSWVGLDECNTEQTLWVVDSSCLEDLGNDWDGAVNWVGDDQDVCIWGRLGSGLCEITDNRGVGVEKIITGHSWLTGNTGWDKNDLSTLQGCCETAWCWVISGNLALGVDVADISGNTWGETDIVKSEVCNTGVELQEKRQRLSNSTSSTENCDFRQVSGSCGECSSLGSARQCSACGKHYVDMSLL